MEIKVIKLHKDVTTKYGVLDPKHCGR